jgi:hypothetical protein
VAAFGSFRSWAGAGVVIGSLMLGATATASGVASPSACAVLTKAHPEKAFGHGKVLAVSHRKAQKYGAGASATTVCSEKVGTQAISLSLSSSGGGFGGIKVTSQTHPSGLGAGDTLTVGTTPSGNSPVDFLSFHHGNVYAVVTANGAAPSVLTTFARAVYRLL